MIEPVSTCQAAARLPTVSPCRTCTTTPAIGGMSSTSPFLTRVDVPRDGFDQRSSSTVTLNLLAIDCESSPSPTVYLIGSWRTGTAVGRAIGLMTVPARPSATWFTSPPWAIERASALATPNRSNPSVRFRFTDEYDARAMATTRTTACTERRVTPCDNPPPIRRRNEDCPQG